jgi:hypothetical protein
VALPFGCAKNPVRIISTTYIDFSAKMAQQLLKKSLTNFSLERLADYWLNNGLTLIPMFDGMTQSFL